MATRLTKAARREQFLEVAAEARGRGRRRIADDGGLRPGAGVTKALPYRHFDNADDVLVVLQTEVNNRIAARVLDWLASAPDMPVHIDAVITAFFDVVAEQSNVLAVLATAGPEVADKVPGGARVGMHFAADILKQSFGVSARQAPLAAEVLLGVLIAAARSWASAMPGARPSNGWSSRP